MNEELVVLKAIGAALEKLDAKVIGEVGMDEQSGCLTLFDGKLTVRANIFRDKGMHPSIAHVHVMSTIAMLSNGTLDACVMGVSEDREEGLAQAGSTWVTLAAAPILSLCHASAVGEATHFCGKEKWGVQGCHGFAGPAMVRCADAKNFDLETVIQSAMFDNVAELTPGGLLHIAKVTLSQNGKAGWKREIEIDGHGAGYVNENWELGIPLPDAGNVIITRFAVYHYADCPDIAAERQALDDAITEYVKALQDDPALDPTSVEDVLVHKGHGAAHAYWLDYFVPLAFGRVLMADMGIPFSGTYILAQRHGRLSEPLELMRNPVFARAQALGWHFSASADYHNGFERAAMCSSEFKVLNNALNSGSRPEDITAHPTMIPDIEANDEDITKATEIYLAQFYAKQGTPASDKPKEKAWWRFWK